MYVSKVEPGRQVYVLPKNLFDILGEKLDTPTEIFRFPKMRTILTQDQLVALAYFSSHEVRRILGLTLGKDPTRVEGLYGNITYPWYFPGEAGLAVSKTEADQYALDAISQMVDGGINTTQFSQQYQQMAKALCDDLIMTELKTPIPALSNVSSLYSVLAMNARQIFLVLNPGFLSQMANKRQQELRRSLYRSILGKLDMYYERAEVARSDWFDGYIKHLAYNPTHDLELA